MFTRITPATAGRGAAVALALCLTGLARGQETPKQPTPAQKMNSELGIVGEPPIKSPRPLVDVPPRT